MTNIYGINHEISYMYMYISALNMYTLYLQYASICTRVEFLQSQMKRKRPTQADVDECILNH